MKQFRFYILVSICCVVAACSNVPTKKISSIPNKAKSTEIVEVSSFDRKLGEIEAAYLATEDVAARNQSLIILADKSLRETNCTTAEIIVNHVQESFKNNPVQNNGQQAFINLIKAECTLLLLQNISDLSNKQPLINEIETWLLQARQAFSNTNEFSSTDLVRLITRTSLAYANYLAEQSEYGNALQQLLNTNDAIDLMPQPEYNNTVWNWYTQINREQRVALNGAYSELNDFSILLDTIEDTTINDNVRQTTIKQWLLKNPNNELALNVPLQVQKYLERSYSEGQRIAVLLPLSGRLSGQGEVIKQGILSAYYDRLTKPSSNYLNQVSLEFIDTGSLNNMNDSINIEQLSDYDTVIGPLLRSHIEQFKDFKTTGKQHLYLNQANTLNEESNNLVASFSLSPEQEAEQIVAIMRRQNIKNPIVINDGSVMTKRMNDAFNSAWESTKLTDSGSSVIKQIQYTDNKSMRVGITAALDVLQSKKRIQQLSNISSERVYSVTRNRRDIDAFVVFARPNDLELINPIIESSISLFTNEQIPVFATSYSYDHKQSKNSQRDLRNVVFVDMPWLLPQGREQQLSTSIDTLFNQPPSAFLRLFAFGYDSLAVVDNFAQLSTFAHMSINGLSGVLSIEQQQLSRKLTSLAISSGVK